MRIALVGATGRIGSRTVEVLGRAGQQTVASAAAKASTSTRGKGLTAALTGVDAVVDASSSNAIEHDEAVAFFSASTRDLLVAEAQTGVSHHVLPSIVGIARCAGNAHTAGKRAQEALVEGGPVPWSILPATQSTTSPRW